MIKITNQINSQYHLTRLSSYINVYLLIMNFYQIRIYFALREFSKVVGGWKCEMIFLEVKLQLTVFLCKLRFSSTSYKHLSNESKRRKTKRMRRAAKKKENIRKSILFKLFLAFVRFALNNAHNQNEKNGRKNKKNTFLPLARIES